MCLLGTFKTQECSHAGDPGSNRKCNIDPGNHGSENACFCICDLI